MDVFAECMLIWAITSVEARANTTRMTIALIGFVVLMVSVIKFRVEIDADIAPFRATVFFFIDIFVSLHSVLQPSFSCRLHQPLEL